jgi:hypothetical protein
MAVILPLLNLLLRLCASLDPFALSRSAAVLDPFTFDVRIRFL